MAITKQRVRVKKKDTKVARCPMTKREWDNLLRKMIAKAASQGDKRTVLGMRTALEKGRSEKFLRTRNVICEADIQRELPAPKPLKTSSSG